MPTRSGKRTVQLILGHGERAKRRESFLDGALEVRSSRGVRGPERILLEALNQEVSGRVLVAGGRVCLPALAAGKLFPEAEVHLLFMDGYDLKRARAALLSNSAGNVRSSLAADLPEEGDFDWVVLGVSKAGEATLTGELLRAAQRALKDGGKLLAGTDNPRDHWLREQIREVFGAATLHQKTRAGTAYVARKRADRRTRPRDYRRRFRARLFGRELALESRPGVFSHGEVDQGTLALSEVARVTEASRTIDMGSGCGALGIAAALAAPRGRALLVDSNLRAARVARENIARNGASGNSLVLLSHDFRAVRDASFDLALANPPYYGDYRIAGLFAREARRALAPGGELFLVTKTPERPGQLIGLLFGSCRILERRGYAVIQARKS